MTAPVTVAFGSATDAGLRRRINEDSHIAAPPLFLVADGMGGHQAGEVASATVIDEFAVFAGHPSLGIEDVRAAPQATVTGGAVALMPAPPRRRFGRRIRVGRPRAGG